MFVNPTVIITGAGASCHYGYPTGAGLINEMAGVAQQLCNFYQEMMDSGYGNQPDYVKKLSHEGPKGSIIRNQYYNALSECEDFIRRLNDADLIVIDYFLGQNMQFEGLGKLLIAWVILRAESRKQIKKGNWIRHITHNLALGCEKSEDLLNNNINFITFNYDTSLERQIFRALRALSIFNDGDIDRFLKGDRFYHVYGAVNSGLDAILSFEGFYDKGMALSDFLQSTINIVDSVDARAKCLQVIDPKKKLTDATSIKIAQDLIVKATKVAILGFGFDPVNINILGLDRHLINGEAEKSIVFTNYQDNGRINGIVGKLTSGRGDPFYELRRVENRVSFEKSTRDVDIALSSDFELA